MEEYSIQASGLTRRYGTFTAVDNLDLAVRPGEFFGFLGPNGAGKSTTIRMLCGQLPPSEGTATVAGYDIRHAPLEVKQHIGVLSEETTLYERLSAAEFLVFAGQMHGLSLREARSRTDELLHLMGLTEARDRLIMDYSMGMKKKTALAAALLHGPRVLFLDEPFNGVDPLSVRAICDVLRTAADQRGVTIFFTSHVLEVVERLCSRVAVIQKGRFIGLGTVEELRTQANAASDAPLEEIYLSLLGTRTETASLSWLK